MNLNMNIIEKHSAYTAVAGPGPIPAAGRALPGRGAAELAAASSREDIYRATVSGLSVMKPSTIAASARM